MEAAGGRQDAALAERVRAAPHRFELFQAIRLLELEGRRAAGRAAIGFDAPPEREAVRLTGSASLTYPATAVRRVEARPDGVATLEQSALGFVGVLGVLPLHYGELIHRRVQQKDFALRDFLDFLLHRPASFFFRAWRKYRFAFDFERAELEGGESDDFTRTLRALVGLGTAGLSRERSREWLYYAGLFADPRRSQAGFAGLIGDVLDAPVAVEQFVGRWLELEPDQCSRVSAAPGSAASGQDAARRLGQGFVLGTRVWDVATKIRARVGPLSCVDFSSLLPGSPRLLEIEALARDFLDAETACELELVLAPGEARGALLGRTGRLGRDAFLEAGRSSTMPVVVRITLRTDRTTDLPHGRAARG